MDFYHGFLLGLLSGLKDYEILSNRESGDGRYDIILKPYDEKQPAVILELKRAKKFTEMESLCKDGLKQITELHYDDEIVEEGYPRILKYVICFCKKSCMVMLDKSFSLSTKSKVLTSYIISYQNSTHTCQYVG